MSAKEKAKFTAVFFPNLTAETITLGFTTDTGGYIACFGHDHAIQTAIEIIVACLVGPEYKYDPYWAAHTLHETVEQLKKDLKKDWMEREKKRLENELEKVAQE